MSGKRIPFEIMNHILSFRPSHPTAVIIKNLMIKLRNLPPLPKYLPKTLLSKLKQYQKPLTRPNIIRGVVRKCITIYKHFS